MSIFKIVVFPEPDSPTKAMVSPCFTVKSNPWSTSLLLPGLDFTVKQGETIALVGESGSGKTTILNMLIGFILPSGGQLMLDGKDMKGLNLRTYRRFLSVVPQTPVLFTGTVRENITYGLEHVSEEQIAQAVEAAN